MLVFAIVGVAAPGSQAAARCLAAFVSLYIFAYGASWGPVASCLVGEISSTKLRSKTIAIGTSALWISDVVIVCTIPYLIDANHLNLGTKVGFIFGGFEVIIFCWVALYVPETKDRSLEEIDEMFLDVSLLVRLIMHAEANTSGCRKLRQEISRRTSLLVTFKVSRSKSSQIRRLKSLIQRSDQVFNVAPGLSSRDWSSGHCDS